MTNPFLSNKIVDMMPRQDATDLSADLDSASPKVSDSSGSGQKIIGQNSDSFTPRRTHLEIRTDVGVYVDVEQFLLIMTQRGLRKWQVVIDAIRFYAAFMSGNPRNALQKYPHLLALLSAESEKSSDSGPSFSFIESESTDLEIQIDQEKEKRVRSLSEKLAEVARMDLKIKSHAVKLVALAKILEAAGYTPADLDTWLAHCWPKDWRHKPGLAPALHIIEKTIAEVRSLKDRYTGDPISGTTNPYLANEYFQRRAAHAEQSDAEPQIPERTKLTIEQTHYKDELTQWSARLETFQWQLRSAAASRYLFGDLKLIDIQKTASGATLFTCETRSAHVKADLEKNLWNWQVSLTEDIYRVSRKDAEINIRVEIQILVQGEPS